MIDGKGKEKPELSLFSLNGMYHCWQTVTRAVMLNDVNRVKIDDGTVGREEMNVLIHTVARYMTAFTTYIQAVRLKKHGLERFAWKTYLNPRLSPEKIRIPSEFEEILKELTCKCVAVNNEGKLIKLLPSTTIPPTWIYKDVISTPGGMKVMHEFLQGDTHEIDLCMTYGKEILDDDFKVKHGDKKQGTLFIETLHDTAYSSGVRETVAAHTWEDIVNIYNDFIDSWVTEPVQVDPLLITEEAVGVVLTDSIPSVQACVLGRNLVTAWTVGFVGHCSDDVRQDRKRLWDLMTTYSGKSWWSSNAPRIQIGSSVLTQHPLTVIPISGTGVEKRGWNDQANLRDLNIVESCLDCNTVKIPTTRPLGTAAHSRLKEALTDEFPAFRQIVPIPTENTVVGVTFEYIRNCMERAFSVLPINGRRKDSSDRLCYPVPWLRLPCHGEEIMFHNHPTNKESFGKPMDRRMETVMTLYGTKMMIKPEDLPIERLTGIRNRSWYEGQKNTWRVTPMLLTYSRIEER